MQDNTGKYVLIFAAVFTLLIGSFSGGFLVAQAFPLFTGNNTSLLPSAVTTSTTPPVDDPQDMEELFEPFWEAWDYVVNHYVDQPVDKTLLMRGAISGMLSALGDPHTAYMDPDAYSEQTAPLEGSYEGIGAWVDASGEFLIIISPMPGSPAEAGGLKTDDQVIAVDGDDMTGMAGELVLRRIKGPAGTNVILTIFRASSGETFDVEITRQKIEIPSVVSEILEDEIAYIQLTTFGEQTHQELREQIRELKRQNPKGLILDLRNNGGGFLATAIDVTSEFVSQSPIVYQEYGNGHRITYDAKRFGLATEIPLVILINGGTASASEITAGAVQDYERGLLVGTQSYGKGSVQNWTTLTNDQGAIRVTVAGWLTPNERQINGVGLTPDYIVEITEEDIAAGIDPQLEKAIELLLAGQ